MKTFSLNLNKVRLITKEELEYLGCYSTNNNCSDVFSCLLNISFWTGTSYENDYIWFLVSDGNFSNYIKYDRFGVRPVVEITI